MNTKDFIESGAIESYVLGLSEADEIVLVEQLRMQYPEVDKAIIDFETSLENRLLNENAPPKEVVKEELFNKLGLDLDTPEKGKIVPLYPNLKIRSFQWSRIAIAACIVLLLSSFYGNYYYYNLYQSTQNKYAALLSEKDILTSNQKVVETKYSELRTQLELIASADFNKINLLGVKGKENSLATVFWNTTTKEVYLFANRLPKAPQEKQYQLWAIVDGKPVDAGVLVANEGIYKLKTIVRAQAFAITLEKNGGSLSPSLDQMYVLGKV